jgi:hypothetical protein
MTQIVEQCGEPNEPFMFYRELADFAHQTRDVEDSKRVLEASVQRSRIDQIGECKLANAPESLEDRGSNDIGFLTS